MAKQLNVDLNIKANTGDAKKQIMDLQQALAKVTSNGLNGQQMKDAAAAAKELQMHLSKAVNVDTGKLNLNAFNTSLKQSGSNVQTLSTKLLTAGTTGQTAFVKLAQSIAAADRPIVTMNSHLSTFFTTLKNTARWQISSSILHGFMGAIQGAYGYAQDLNESLNNIRIVTGQSTEDMAKFAEQANKAARALSTTTTAYTDAALIYYQQGLKGKEVTDRADVTIKLANVSRQSAEEVSSQMTAIWNNFYDGSQSLEYYADVITKLGASTASSSDEIAQGLQKFAAVADTVGLSYEKATAALATVVAETRQSADVVGTAFKTMFARFQGLSLGETLEDGVDLNKYSKALATIGVNIIDANGELKKMDLILDETAQKWNQISEAQRVALAETVAGTRQYAQFMAVMNNYDKIQSNQKLAEGSTGSLQSQQNIYAESWEAASKRVKAAAEGLYDSLLDDEFFIKATNLIGTVVNGINDFIKGLGGVKPLLIGISGILLNLFAGKIAQGAENLKINLTTMFQTPMQQAKEYAKTFQETVVAAQEKFGVNFEKASFSDRTALTNANALAQAKNKAMIASKDLSAAEQQAMEIELSVIEAQMQVTQSVADSIDTEREHISTLMDEMTAQEAISQIEALRKEELRALTQEEADALAALRAQDPDDFAGILEAADAYEKAQIATANFKEETNQLISTQENINAAMREAFETLLQYNAGVGGAEEVTVDLGAHLGETTQQLGTLAEGLRQGNVSQGEAIQQMVSYRNEIQTLGIETDEVKQAFDNFTKVQKDSKSTAKDYASAVEKIQSVLKNLKITAKSTGESFKGFRDQLVAMEGGIKNVTAMEKSYNSLSKKTKELKEAQELLNNALKEFNPSHMQSGLEIVSKLSGSIMSASMVINSFKSAIDALNNQDMSFGEKLTTIMMSLGMGIPSAISAFQAFSKVITINSAAVEGLNKVIQANLAVEAANAAAKEEQIALLAQESSLRWMRISAQKLSQTATLEETAADQAAKAVKAGLIAEEQEQAVAEALVNAVKEKGGSITQQEIAQILLETGVKEGSTTATKANIVVRLAHAIAAKTEASAITSVWLALGLLAVIIAAVAAAIWGLIKLVKMSIDAWNADAIAAEKAAKTAQDLADAATEAKDRLNDIKTAVDSYKSVVDKLNDCTKGTKEWNEALEEVHAQVSELLQKYPELLSHANLFNADGTLNIGVLNEFERKAQSVADAAQAASLQGAAMAAQARTKSDVTDASRKYEYYSDYGAYNMGHKDGTFSTVRSDLDKLLSTYKENGSQALELSDVYEALGSEMGANATITDDYAKSLMSLAESSVAATNMMNNAAKLTIDQWAAGAGVELAAGQSVLMTEAYNDAYQDFYNAVKTASNQNSKSDNKDHSKLGSAFNGTSFEGMSLTAAFNAARGSNYALARNGVRGTDNNRTYAYLENGEEKEYKIEEMQATIAAAAALEKMGQAANETAAQLAKMESGTKEFLGSGSLEGLSKSEFAKYRASLGLAAGQEVTSDQAKQLLINQGISEEIAEQLKTSFASNLNIDWDSITEKLPATLDSKITEGLTLSNGEALVKTISQLNLGPAGAAAGDSFVKGLNGMLGTLDEDKQQEALSQLLNIDWSNWDAGKEAEKIIKDLGGDIDNIDWEKFIDDMRRANSAFPNFESLKNAISEVATVLGDLDFGKAIKDEDYNKLIAYNDAWREFFITQADGTHQFIGNAEQMKQAMADNLTEQKRLLDTRASAAKGVQDAGWTGRAVIGIDDRRDNGVYAANTLQNLYNTESGKNLLESLGYTEDRIQEFVKNASTSKEAIKVCYQEIADALNQDYDVEAEQWNEARASLETTLNGLLSIRDTISQEAYDKQLTVLANNASTLEELQRIRAAGEHLEGGAEDEGSGLDSYEYSQALVKLAGNYANCTDEIDKYQKALMTGTEAEQEAARAALELSIQTGELAEKYGFDATETENYSKRLAASFEEQGMSQAAAAKLGLQAAIANQRLDRGLLSLNKNLDDYKTKLKDTNKGSAEWSKTMDSLKTDLADILNVDITTLTDAFGEAVLESEDLEKALDGDVEAIKRLQTQAAEAMILEIRSNLPENSAQLENFTSAWEYLKANMAEAIESPGIDQTNLINSFNAMIEAGNMTKEQIESALAGLHVSANVKTEYIAQKVTVPTTITEQIRYPSGTDMIDTNMDGTPEPITRWRTETQTFDGPPHEVDGYVPKYTIEGTEGPGGIQTAFVSAPSPKVSFSSTKSGGAGGKSGGGGNTSKKDLKNSDDEFERYHVIKRQLADLSREYDRLSKAKDRAFGAGRLALMEKESANLREQIKLQKQYISEIQKNAQSDYTALLHGKENAYSYQGQQYNVYGLDHYGISAELDENNNITNWYAIKEAALAEYNAATTSYNAGQLSEDQYALAEKQYEEFNKLIDQFEESNDDLQDAIDTYYDKIYEWQSNTFEKITYELEVKLILDEGKMKWLEYQMKKIGDSVYHATEAISQLFSVMGEDKSDLIGQQVGHYTDMFNDLNEAWNTFDEDGNRSISTEDYVEGLKQVRDGLYEQLEAWMEIDEQMEHYYADTLAKIDEEIKNVTDHMRHNVEVVEHLQNILKLTGREEDFEMMNKMLTANMEQNEAIYQSSKEYYEMLAREREAAQRDYDNAMKNGGKEEQEIAKNNLDAIIKQCDEAESQMYSDLETFLESCNAVVENELNRTKKAIEDIYTDGKGWDYLNKMMELSSQIGDKYLTKTNQVYETNKLLRTLQQDIDKTSNVAAKQKIANFANEIKSLQNINELSKNQLEIAKAQYEVLKAQIALEDARDAKSTVRLQRDSEGNYGYVYTADQDKVTDAQQNLEDKQNDLYNLVREQENESAQEIMRINQEKTEALAELWYEYYVKKTITEEEFNERSAEINSKYNTLLEAATKDHITARELLNQTSITKENDSWTKEYEDLVKKGYAYISAEDEFWTLGFGALTGKRQDWFNAENPEWTKYYNGIMGLSEQTQLKYTAELGTMETNTKDAIARFDAAVGVDPESGLRGSLLNFEKKLQDVTTETGHLRDSLIGEEGLIKQLEGEAKGVRETTIEWGKYYDYLNAEVIPLIEATIKEIQHLIEVASQDTHAVHTIETQYITTGTPVGENPAPTPTGGGGGSGSGGGGSGSGGGSGVTADRSYDLAWHARGASGVSLSGGGALTRDEAYSEFNRAKAENDSNYERYIYVAVMHNGREEARYTFTKPKTGGGSGGGCFAPGTLILMADLSQKRIEDVSTGEYVISYNPEKDRFEKQQVLKTISVHADILLDIKLSYDITLHVTPGHPLLTSQGWKSLRPDVSLKEHDIIATPLSIGDILIGFGGELVVEDIVEHIGQYKVYDFTIGDCHTFVAENIVVHNMSMVNVNLKAAYDTGGYTGDWIGGAHIDDGRLAVLHQKELVLNQEDTKNVLSAVNMVRDIAQQIDLRANSRMTSSTLISPSYSGGEQTIEQTVTITAEFPNATQHSEIEEAFNNLINRATQYANRPKNYDRNS